MNLTSRFGFAEFLTGVDAQDFERLGHQTNIGVGNDVMRMGVEDELVCGRGVWVGPRRAHLDGNFVADNVHVHVHVVTRQPCGYAGPRRPAAQQREENGDSEPVPSVEHHSRTFLAVR